MTAETPPAASWDEAAADYEAYAEPLTRQFAEQALALAGGVALGQRLIDVAAGTGALALLAASAGADVLAIDFSPGMVGRLNARLAASDRGHGRARVMDGQALAVPDASFDVAFSIFGVVLFPDWRQGLAEMARVVRPGGRACVAAWANAEGAGPSIALHNAYRSAFPGRALPPPAPGMARFTDARLLASDMRELGFDDVAVHTATGRWEAESPEWAAENLGRFFLRFPLVAALSAAERIILRSALRDELSQRLDGGRVVYDCEANIAIARR